MKDAMISVRMPSALVKELKELSQENHYIDLSEQVRDILRVKCSQHLQESKPEVSEERRETTKAELSEKERLVQNLQSIIEELKRGL